VTNPHQRNVPPELSFFVSKGLNKVPQERYQSAKEMIAAPTAIQRGNIRAQCPRTFMKRMVFRAMRFSDAHAAPSILLTVLVVLVFGFGLVSAIRLLTTLFVS
jgi:eukaryotic-like serine/threonine-protein kinase